MTTQPSTATGVGFDLDIARHVGVLKRRWFTVLFVLAAVVAATWYVTDQQPPQYRARVEFVVGTLLDPAGTSDAGAGDVLSHIFLGNSQLSTQTAAIESLPVAERVREILGTSRSAESLVGSINASLSDQLVLSITATAGDAQEAADVANAFVDAYLDLRSDAALDQVIKANERIQTRLAQAREELARLNREITLLQPAPLPSESDDEAEQPSLDPVTAQEVQLFETQRTQVLSEIAALERQLSTLDPSTTITSVGGQIIRPATAASSPFSPQPLRNIGLSIVLGLTLGLGLAYLRDHLDDAIRSEADVERLVDAPVVGRIRGWQGKRDESVLVTVGAPSSTEAEAYRTLRTNVHFLANGPTTILVTSSVSGEGKSTTAANLAVTWAQLGHRVVLVDADLRRPTLDKSFRTPRSPGLSELLAGDLTPADAVRDVPAVKNLRFLPCGTIPPNPAELLASNRMTELLDVLKRHAPVVIVDAPPTLAVSDALTLAGKCDLTLLVVKPGTTRRSALRAGIRQLANLNQRPEGVVLNAIPAGSDDYGAYTYYYEEYTTSAPEDIQPDPAQPSNGAPLTNGAGSSRRRLTFGRKN